MFSPFFPAPSFSPASLSTRCLGDHLFLSHPCYTSSSSASVDLSPPETESGFSSHSPVSDSFETFDPDHLAIVSYNPLNYDYLDSWRITQDLFDLIRKCVEFCDLLKLSDSIFADSAKQKMVLIAPETHRKRKGESRSKLEMELRRLGISECSLPTSRARTRSAH
ncbi:unnamed protein product [Linum trigynum]|uniref:Uncharacterized protein n=1 Tax=Linum trigynum TaxID=586398 RepID=A0AAV2ESC7_9ROSI